MMLDPLSKHKSATKSTKTRTGLGHEMFGACDSVSEEPLLVTFPCCLITTIVTFQKWLHNQKLSFAEETIHPLIFKQVISST